MWVCPAAFLPISESVRKRTYRRKRRDPCGHSFIEKQKMDICIKDYREFLEQTYGNQRHKYQKEEVIKDAQV